MKQFKCPYCKKKIYGPGYRNGELIMIEFVLRNMQGQQLEARPHTCKFDMEMRRI